VRARIEAAFRDAGVTGFLPATDIHTGREVAVRADEPVVLASVFKVPLLVTFHRQAADRLLDPTEPVTLRPEDRTVGPTGHSSHQVIEMTIDRSCLYDGGSSRPKIIDRHTSRSSGGCPTLRAGTLHTDHELRLPY
jgi:hypothetical protein